MLVLKNPKRKSKTIEPQAKVVLRDSRGRKTTDFKKARSAEVYPLKKDGTPRKRGAKVEFEKSTKSKAAKLEAIRVGVFDKAKREFDRLAAKKPEIKHPKKITVPKKVSQTEISNRVVDYVIGERRTPVIDSDISVSKPIPVIRKGGSKNWIKKHEVVFKEKVVLDKNMVKDRGTQDQRRQAVRDLNAAIQKTASSIRKKSTPKAAKERLKEELVRLHERKQKVQALDHADNTELFLKEGMRQQLREVLGDKKLKRVYVRLLHEGNTTIRRGKDTRKEQPHLGFSVEVTKLNLDTIDEYVEEFMGEYLQKLEKYLQRSTQGQFALRGFTVDEYDEVKPAEKKRRSKAKPKKQKAKAKQKPKKRKR